MTCYLVTLTVLDAVALVLATSSLTAARRIAAAAVLDGFDPVILQTASDRLPPDVEMVDGDWRLLMALPPDYKIDGVLDN